MLRSRADGRVPPRGSPARPGSAEDRVALVRELYLELGDPVYRYLAASLGGGPDAEDATASTFVAVLERIRDFRGDSSPRTWVFAIARHKAADALRARARRRSVASADDLGASEDVEGVAVDRLRLAEAVAALGRIPADRAEAIRLRVFAGLSVGETAHVLGKSEGAVKMLAHRGLLDLREILLAGTKR